MITVLLPFEEPPDVKHLYSQSNLFFRSPQVYGITFFNQYRFIHQLESVTVKTGQLYPPGVSLIKQDMSLNCLKCRLQAWNSKNINTMQHQKEIWRHQKIKHCISLCHQIIFHQMVKLVNFLQDRHLT